jgi:hypothetical protein
MLGRLIRKIQTRPERVRRRAHEAMLDRFRPLSPTSDDTYLVSYPRAGITWFSFLIANVNLLLNSQPVQATWWNIREYVFDIQESRQVPPNPLPLPCGRFIHSHSEFNPTYGKVIYLIRDPRDTLASYYDMTTKLGWFRADMDAFLDSEKFGIPAWNRHIDGWIRQHGPMSRVYFIRYEDLKADPLEVLVRIYRLFGLQPAPGLLETAIARSSFAAMRDSEAEYRRHSHDLGSQFQFMRKGVAGGFSGELTAGQIAKIEDRCSDWMKLFHYDSAGKSPGSESI